jgi:hypothetical protein
MSAKKDKAKPKADKKSKAEGKPAMLSVAAHPRAGAQVRRAKGWGGLAGFAIAAFLSIQAGVPTDQIGLRALGAGIAAYLVAWACAVTVWRYLLVAEVAVLTERYEQAQADQETASTIPADTHAPSGS